MEQLPKVFEQQRRDDVWAGNVERELGIRLAKMHGRLENQECREDLCRLTVAGSKGELGKAMEDLEKLRGYAASMLLTKPEARGDGTMGLVVYAIFER